MQADFHTVLPLLTTCAHTLCSEMPLQSILDQPNTQRAPLRYSCKLSAWPSGLYLHCMSPWEIFMLFHLKGSFQQSMKEPCFPIPCSLAASIVSAHIQNVQVLHPWTNLCGSLEIWATLSRSLSFSLSMARFSPSSRRSIRRTVSPERVLNFFLKTYTAKMTTYTWGKTLPGISTANTSGTLKKQTIPHIALYWRTGHQTAKPNERCRNLTIYIG